MIKQAITTKGIYSWVIKVKSIVTPSFCKMHTKIERRTPSQTLMVLANVEMYGRPHTFYGGARPTIRDADRFKDIFITQFRVSRPAFAVYTLADSTLLINSACLALSNFNFSLRSDLDAGFIYEV